MKYFDYTLFNSDFDELFVKKFSSKDVVVINTLNPHSFVVAEKDEKFKAALINCDYLLVDGVGVKILLLLSFKNVRLFNGPFLHKKILFNFREIKLKVFYLGSTLDVLQRIKQKIDCEAPVWDVETYSPPFVNEFSEAENNYMVKIVNNFEPDILFIGMTAPKQEKWVEQNKYGLRVKYIISIGAVFDYYAGTKSFPPSWLVRMHFIWLYRLVTDFKHVWRRTFISLPKFFIFNFLKFVKSPF